MIQYSLDLETAPNEGDLSNGYALEPWRVRQGKAHISSISVYGSDDSQDHMDNPSREYLITQLEALSGKEVWTHNGVFDVAWLIATLEPDKTKPIPACIMNIRWRDTMTLAKWITNGKLADDMQLSYSLVALIEQFLKKMEGAQEFINMKRGATLDPSSEYWSKRAVLDTLWTLRLAQFLWQHLKPEQVNGYIVECACIPPIADSWLTGLRIDENQLKVTERALLEENAKLCKQYGISETVIASPTQLGKLLFDQMGYEPLSYTPTGKPQCNSDTIKILAYRNGGDEKLDAIMKVKENLTLLSKYIKTTHIALARTGDGYIYPIPRIFGTSTGRLTYSNETLRGVKVSIAIHQLPRKAKDVRKIFLPPEGMLFAEYDGMSQESRVMGIWANEPAMIDAFGNDKDLHAMMAAKIYGIPYETVVQGKKDNDTKMIEYRQMGKLTNLSSNFRIGGASLSQKSFTEYNVYMDVNTGNQLVRAFKSMYPGIPKYWDAIIQFAKQNGYTYTLAQRRYKVPKEFDFRVEGSVISHPIQGTAAEMTYAAIAHIRNHKLVFTLHDGIFVIIKEEAESLVIERKLNTIDYDKLWNVKLPIKLLFEMNVGKNLGEVK